MQYNINISLIPIYFSDLEEAIYKNADFTWWVSDCEELVGVTHMR